MKYLPIYLKLDGERIVVSGAGSAAAAKLRVLSRTEARISVFGASSDKNTFHSLRDQPVHWEPRPAQIHDIRGAALLYCANQDPIEDLRVANIGKRLGIPVTVVDDLRTSQFITPAIVDRDPVTIAIGTEGTAPLLASWLRAELEGCLSPSLGLLSRIGGRFRSKVHRLRDIRARRLFWSEFYFDRGPRAIDRGGESEAQETLQTLLEEALSGSRPPGHVSLVGAGPGDPELLTLKARRRLHQADVVLHDRLIPDPVLDCARREARLIPTGKTGYRKSWKQEDINRLMIEEAQSGQHVVRLKSGDPAMFGRLDEEIEALDAAGIAWEVVPGITAASGTAAALGVSLTRRSRNTGIRFVTGHDAQGFASQDWTGLARPGTVTAVYMGKRAASYIRGCLLMHGASSDTPVSVVENASQPDQTVIATTLLDLPGVLDPVEGPAMILIGLQPRSRSVATATVNTVREAAI